MQLIFLFVVFTLHTTTTCDAQATMFPNARFLGMGYNVLRGNPDHDLRDPGFTFPVLKFTWTNNITTSDRKYLIPDHIQALQTQSCNHRSQTNTEFDVKSYQNSLSYDVSGELSFGGLGGRNESDSLWSVRFSASYGYQKVNETTTKQRRVYVSARGKCIAYELAVNYASAPIGVHDDFARDVRALPLQADQNAYHTLLNRYGTHFTIRTTMGAKMVVRSEFTEQNYSELLRNGVSGSAGAEVSFAKLISFDLSGAGEGESERLQRTTYESKRTSKSVTYLGSHPPSDGRWETWAQSTKELCFPIMYSLAPLTSLLEHKFFPDMPADELTTRRNLLAGAYDSYCRRVSHCQVPGPDRVPILMSNVATSIHGATRVSCIAGYKLLSCGMENLQSCGEYDKLRHAIPFSSTECDCKDDNGAKCRPWCTNVDVNFTIQASTWGRDSDVICPQGHKVLGCAAQHDGVGSEDFWPRWYPRRDGRGCHCYSARVQCYASCASNVQNHEIRTQYGTGTITATCSPGNYVLGCGIKPLWYQGKTKFDPRRQWQVIDVNSCQCSDSCGATCYAICGQLT